MASALIADWLCANDLSGADIDGYKEVIGLFRWPLRATVLTKNSSGDFVKIQLSVGSTLRGTFFGGIACIKILKKETQLTQEAEMQGGECD